MKSISFDLLNMFSRIMGGPRGFRDLGRLDIFFMDLGSSGNNFRGAGEQAHTFGD